MWTSQMLTDEEVQTLVGVGDAQLGLTILRTIIRPDSQWWNRAVANLKEAKATSAEVKILATPWSPPAAWKSNNDVNNGGKLLTKHYADYANHLNSYVSFMAQNGVSIDVVSVQNEPDWHPSYESCDWSGDEFRNFVRDHGDAINAQVMIGESLRFNQKYSDPSLKDEQALANFEIVGGHIYDDAHWDTMFTPYPLAEQKNKERWMTEWNIHQADGDGQAIWSGDNQAVWDETLDAVLASVHRSMESNWNAYIWWWARRFYSFIGDGESKYGTTRGKVLKRGWAFSHYAKFVRPGATRIKATTQTEDVEVTAYEDTDRYVVVMLNRSESDVTGVPIELSNSIVDQKAFVTSRSKNREEIAVSNSNGQIGLSVLPARSIVTIVLMKDTSR